MQSLLASGVQELVLTNRTSQVLCCLVPPVAARGCVSGHKAWPLAWRLRGDAFPPWIWLPEPSRPCSNFQLPRAAVGTQDLCILLIILHTDVLMPPNFFCHVPKGLSCHQKAFGGLPLFPTPSQRLHSVLLIQTKAEKCLQLFQALPFLGHTEPTWVSLWPS